MKWTYNDGGRAQAGYLGHPGDCVCRAIAIATGKTYQEVYDALNALKKSMRQTRLVRGSSARNGVARPVYEKYLQSIGWTFVPTMKIASGCKVHLHDGELPNGRIICRLSKHLVAVIDGVIHDTHDPQREIAYFEPDRGQELKPVQGRNRNGVFTIRRRCVYGYYVQAAGPRVAGPSST